MAKQRTLKAVLGAMDPARRKRIVGRSVQLARKYEALSDLRKAREKTQVEVAAKLDVTQPYVAKLERRTDLMLSVLRKYVRSMGGELELKVTFPGSDPVILEGLGETDDEAQAGPRSRARSRKDDQHPR